MCLKCIRKSVRIGRPNMKETCCNGVNKVHKTWENSDVKHNDISIKAITKKCDKCVSTSVTKRVTDEYKGRHRLLGLRPCYKTRYKIHYPVVVHGFKESNTHALSTIVATSREV